MTSCHVVNWHPLDNNLNVIFLYFVFITADSCRWWFRYTALNVHYTGIVVIITQVNKIRSTFCPETKPLVSIQFRVAESESGIRFFPSRQNFAVLPISWLPGLKISFSSFLEKLWEISKIWPDIGDSKLNSAHFKKKKLKIGSAVLEILAI